MRRGISNKKNPYAHARLYFKLVVNLMAWINWLVRIVVLLLGGNLRKNVIRSASFLTLLDCDVVVVERPLVCETAFLVLTFANV